MVRVTNGNENYYLVFTNYYSITVNCYFFIVLLLIAITAVGIIIVKLKYFSWRFFMKIMAMVEYGYDSNYGKNLIIQSWWWL